MSEPVKRRAYQSDLRRQRAEQTRHAILEAARRLFVEQGYAATTVSAIAAAAGYNVDTLYAAVGTKPVLFRLLLETAISGRDEAVPAEERDYVRRIRTASTAGEKIDLYAAAVRAIAGRLTPLFLVMRDVAGSVPEIAAMRDEMAERRAANMRLFATDLAASGELRPDLSLDEIADVVWATSAVEFSATLIRERGWTPERFEEWLATTWRRLFLP